MPQTFSCLIELTWNIKIIKLKLHDKLSYASITTAAKLAHQFKTDTIHCRTGVRTDGLNDKGVIIEQNEASAIP